MIKHAFDWVLLATGIIGIGFLFSGIHYHDVDKGFFGGMVAFIALSVLGITTVDWEDL